MTLIAAVSAHKLTATSKTEAVTEGKEQAMADLESAMKDLDQARFDWNALGSRINDSIDKG